MDKVANFFGRLTSLIKVFMGLVVALILLFVGGQIIWGLLSDSSIDLSGLAWFGKIATTAYDWMAIAPPVFWMVAVTTLVVATMIAKKPWKQVFFLVIVTIFAFWLSPFLNWAGDNLDRGINHGDWSKRADSVRTVKNGTVTVRRGVVENFYVAGEVTLINNNDYSCLKISPDGVFHIRSSNDFRRNAISSKSGETEMVFVEVKPAAECS